MLFPKHFARTQSHVAHFARPLILKMVLASLLASGTSLLAAPPSKKPTYDLAPERSLGHMNRVEVQLEVAGNLRLKKRDQIESLPMTAKATLAYDERLLGLAEVDSQPQPHALRHYREATATISVSGGGAQPKLRNERRTIVVDMAGGTTTMFSPSGALTRDEFDLLQVIGNSLVVSWLLPEHPVAIGESWQQTDAVIGALAGLDAVATCQVQSVLTDVQDGVAIVTLAGTVSGAAEGIATEIELKAKYAFDLTRRQVTGLSLAMKERRSIGHVGPGLEVVAKVRLKLEPIVRSETLDKLAPSVQNLKPTPERLRLLHESVEGHFTFSSEPRWYVTADDPGLVILRMVDRGDLVAQCNISPIAARAKERELDLKQYQSEVQHTLGKHFRQIVAAGESTDSHGQRVYRVVAQGEVEGMPIEWRYYLVAHPSGRRVALAFTVEGPLAERMGNSDRELVSSLVLAKLPPAQPNKTVERSPAPQKR